VDDDQKEILQKKTEDLGFGSKKNPSGLFLTVNSRPKETLQPPDLCIN